MKALVATGQGAKLETVSVRPVGPADVRVKVLRARISTNAKDLCVGKFAPHLVNFPTIIGTSCVGVVNAVGQQVVSGVKPGDLVLCTPVVGEPPHTILQGS